MNLCRLASLVFLCAAAPAIGQASFVNWESPHVHPLDMTPDGNKLLAVNTADNRLEVFDLTSGLVLRLGSIPVGLDPVSVRARSNTEAWVVNHISDSVSVVDLIAMNVVGTITTGDEPCDVVFAGLPQRAFVSVSQENTIKVYDPANIAAAPVLVPVQGESPRALATDGSRVFVAIFESGNRTTILGQPVVSGALNPYPGRPNPPPNAGALFSPPIAAGLPTPPAASLIVRKDASGVWRDDNNGNWSSAVTWDLHDHDVAIIDASGLGVTYAVGLMNLNMAIAVAPTGRITVVGTDAINQIRFEPNVKSTFNRVVMGSFPIAAPASVVVTDLNPHLTYAVRQVPQATRDLAIGDPRAIAWSPDGQTGYIAGMGSGNVLVIDSAGSPQARVNVGQGPTGLVVDAPRARVYCLNKFDASISVIDSSSRVESSRTLLFDPTPAAIKSGRPFLYDTHRTSGLGQAACASCHVDGRTDQIAWDLGDPSGAVKLLNQTCNLGLTGGCENWHPMKGPMTTQTLIGITGTEPLHWRGDREGLGAFNGAFISLMGDDTQLTGPEMAQLQAFVTSLKPPPNPNRTITSALKTSVPPFGNAVNGSNLYNTVRFDGNVLTCNQCHALPTGTNGTLTSAAALQETQSMKIPQLRNMYDKTGFSKTSLVNNRGFGFTHDGGDDTLFNFLSRPVFTFAAGAAGNQQRQDLIAFLMSLSTDTHAGVGVQTTLVSLASAPASQVSLLNTMESLAQSGAVGLVVKGVQGGLQRGYKYTTGGLYQSDRQAETISSAALRAAAAPGSELTFTLVPAVSATRIGIDRDGDGYFDRDEIDNRSNPADPNSVPGACPADIVSVGGLPPPDGVLTGDDFVAFINAFAAGDPLADIVSTGGIPPPDGLLTGDDFIAFTNSFAAGCP